MSKAKPSVPASGKGQQSLFSFFKKPAEPVPVQMQQAKGDLHEPTAVATPKSMAKVASPPQPVPEADCKNALVGKIIEVFWPKDNEWYRGKITSYDSLEQAYTVAYDDGIVEVLNLDQEKYKIIDRAEGLTKKRKLDPAEEEDEEIVISKKRSATGAKSSNKRKIVLDDDDEAEWSDKNEVNSAASSGGSGKGSEDWLTSSSESDSYADESEDDAAEKRKRSAAKSSQKKSGNSGDRAIAKTPGAAKPPLSINSSALKTPNTSSAARGGDTGNTSRASYTPADYSQPTSFSFSPVSDSRPNGGSDDKDKAVFIMPEGVSAYGSHEHNEWPFFNKLKDKDGVPYGAPGYNRRTWYVPPQVLKNQTPAMKQWFDFKCENFDVVLFFKVGKFYELFHMDADVGFKELDLIYMKGTKGHSGFPEVSYGKYASMLVAKGYRVARVEQTETPDMMKERNKSAAKGLTSKVVCRELCSIMSLGTRTFCHLDDVTLMAAGSEESLTGPQSLLLCLKESPIAQSAEADVETVGQNAVVEYGVCYVDTVLGTITLSQFQDDSQRSRLRTMLSFMPPTEVLLEKSSSSLSVAGFSPETVGAIRLSNNKAIFEYLAPVTEMPSDTNQTLDYLKSGNYFKSQDQESKDDTTVWPTVLKAVVRGLSDGSSSLVTLALGGALWHLKRSLIDHEVISMGKFHAYVPPDENETSSALLENASSDGDMEVVEDTDALPRHMVLDAVALANLEILQNNFDKSEKGSLWQFINKCKTAFGRRLLKNWLIKPLLRVQDIQSRASAVEELMSSLADEAEASRKILKNVPDLERLLSRCHTNGSKARALNHPDSRAQMYEDTIYNGRKIRDFVDLINGLETLLQLEDVFSNKSVNSPYLRNVVCSKDGASCGKFPYDEMRQILRHFRQIFDEKQAKRDGTIKPKPGLHAEYDQAMSDVKTIEAALETYLKEQKKLTGISDLNYWGTGKDRYQIEVPIAQTSKVPTKWSTKSQKKTHRRYWTPAIENSLASLVEAEERVAAAEKDTMRSVFEKFDLERNVWSAAVTCTSILDALLSLAIVSSTPGYNWPVLVSRSNGEKPFLRVQAGRHPMLEQSLVQKGSGDYIPNDLELGSPKDMDLASEQPQYTQDSATGNGSCGAPRMLLLSGPNMGGKSTLLRQTCLLCVLAQIGCSVPAESFTLTPVDRIFTRVGASDRILSGQSTFYVELAETALILKAATEDSLCILDELGRGTSTFDGTAIAHAVVEHLVSRVRCRALFATHYHSLADDWAIDPRVKLGHMDCLVQGAADDNEVEKDASEKVTFLYHLCDGSSPKSYGVNVARLAGLPVEVLTLATHKSDAFLSKKESENNASRSKDLMLQRYFDTLVSLVSSSMPNDELYVTVSEVWRRYQHDVKFI